MGICQVSSTDTLVAGGGVLVIGGSVGAAIVDWIIGVVGGASAPAGVIIIGVAILVGVLVLGVMAVCMAIIGGTAVIEPDQGQIDWLKRLLGIEIPASCITPGLACLNACVLLCAATKIDPPDDDFLGVSPDPMDPEDPTLNFINCVSGCVTPPIGGGGTGMPGCEDFFACMNNGIQP